MTKSAKTRTLAGLLLLIAVLSFLPCVHTGSDPVSPWSFFGPEHPEPFDGTGCMPGFVCALTLLELLLLWRGKTRGPLIWGSLLHLVKIVGPAWLHHLLTELLRGVRSFAVWEGPSSHYFVFLPLFYGIIVLGAAALVLYGMLIRGTSGPAPVQPETAGTGGPMNNPTPNLPE